MDFTTWISSVSSAKITTSRAPAAKCFVKQRPARDQHGIQLVPNGNSLAWQQCPTFTRCYIWLLEPLLQHHPPAVLNMKHEARSCTICSWISARLPTLCVTKPRATHDLWGGRMWRMDGNEGCAPSWNGIATSRVGRRNTAI